MSQPISNSFAQCAAESRDLLKNSEKQKNLKIPKNLQKRSQRCLNVF